MAPILGIGGVIHALETSRSMAWVILLAVVLVLGVVAVLFAITLPRFKKLQDLIDRLNLVTREILQGIPVIRPSAGKNTRSSVLTRPIKTLSARTSL